MQTLTSEQRTKLQNLSHEVEEWVNKEFNFIQVNVLETMADKQGSMLLEFIREPEPDYLEFIYNYNLFDELHEWLIQSYEIHLPEDGINSKNFEDYKEMIIEYCEEQREFEDWKDEQRDKNYPMWNTCFEFKSEPPEEFIQAAIKSGFGVIEGLDDFNTILFVAGAGYSFYGQHWIPMYLRLPFNKDKAKEFEGYSFQHL